MIPLGDNVRSRRLPLVTLLLIGTNLLAFAFELALGSDAQVFLRDAAVVPALYSGGDGRLQWIEIVAATLQYELLLRVLLSAFLHGGFLHILGNMVFLWVFGQGVEERLGHLPYLGFYLLCGCASMFTHVWAEPRSQMPCIGASGAVAGVLGAYLVLFPRARIAILLPLGVVSVPAVVFLTAWFLLQWLSGVEALAAPAAGAGGPAWWAHVGGFVLGAGGAGLASHSRLRGPMRRR